MPSVWSCIALKMFGPYQLNVYEKSYAGPYDGSRWYKLVRLTPQFHEKLVLDFEVLPNGRRLDYLAMEKTLQFPVPRPILWDLERKYPHP